jgi:hypothetical protein
MWPMLLPIVVWSTAAAPSPVTMFRGNPEHTGHSAASFFDGQGGVRWRVQTGGAVRSSPAVTATRVLVGSGGIWAAPSGVSPLRLGPPHDNESGTR